MKGQLDTVSEQKTKTIKHEQISTLPFLPFELQEQIFIDCLPKIAVGYPFHQICYTFNALSFVSKEWNYCINNPKTIHTIINSINDSAQNFSVANRFMVAKAIRTYGTKNYIQQCTALYHKITGDLPLSGFSIKELVERGADVNFEHLKGHFLYLASTRNYTYTKQLLELGANPNSEDHRETPLELAIQSQDLNMISLLLEYNPKNKGLFVALREGNPSIIKLLLKQANLTQNELEQGYHYAFKISNNPATQALVDHYLSNM